MGQFDQWRDKCPECDGMLEMAEITLAATGKKFNPRTPLESDGFGLGKRAEASLAKKRTRNGSTEDEIAECTQCKLQYDLAELSLDNTERPIPRKGLTNQQKVFRLRRSLSDLLDFLDEYPHRNATDISGYVDDAAKVLDETL